MSLQDLEQKGDLPEPTSTPIDDNHTTKLTGWRLNCVVGSVLVGLFLSFLDTTIVAVALPTISDQFNDFGR